MKIARIIILALLFFGVYETMAHGSNRRKVYRCYFLKMSKKFNSEGDFFYTIGIARDTIDSVKALINRGIKRNEKLYGSRFVAKPKIIYCRNEDAYLYYGNEGTAGTTWITSTETYVVLWPGGLDIGVIAHELCHAELSARIGWQVRMFQVPAWFDEGLAMQLDNRDAFVWETDSTNFYNYLKPLRGYKTFWYGGYFRVHRNYCLAKIEVDHWLGTEGQQKRLYFLLKGLMSGQNFHYLYEQLDARNNTP